LRALARSASGYCNLHHTMHGERRGGRRPLGTTGLGEDPVAVLKSRQDELSNSLFIQRDVSQLVLRPELRFQSPDQTVSSKDIL
jgi:hypothetical protein